MTDEQLTVRQQLVALLTPLLPAEWRIVPYDTNIDVPAVPTVVVRQQKIEPTKEAPRAAWTFTYTLTLVDPHTDPAKAEDALDENVEILWAALSGSSHLQPTLAEKGLFDGAGRLGYDVTVLIIGNH